METVRITLVVDHPQYPQFKVETRQKINAYTCDKIAENVPGVDQAMFVSKHSFKFNCSPLFERSQVVDAVTKYLGAEKEEGMTYGKIQHGDVFYIPKYRELGIMLRVVASSESNFSDMDVHFDGSRVYLPVFPDHEPVVLLPHIEKILGEVNFFYNPAFTAISPGLKVTGNE